MKIGIKKLKNGVPDGFPEAGTPHTGIGRVGLLTGTMQPNAGRIFQQPVITRPGTG